MKKYADVSKVVYDPKGTDPFTFRWYAPDEVIAGKKMREHLKFALSYWHTIDAEGVDMFGSGTMDKSMGQTDPMAKFRAKADFAFELMEKLNIDYYCFHDVDIAPEGATLAESIANFRVMVDYLYELQKKTGKKCLWVTANNFGGRCRHLLLRRCVCRCRCQGPGLSGRRGEAGRHRLCILGRPRGL